MLNIAVYYNAVITTAAYVLLLVLGWKMYRFTLVNLKLSGKSVSSQEKKSAELNRQLNRVLIIQANDLDKFLNKYIQEIDLANLLLKNLQYMCFSRKCLSTSHKSKMQKTIYYYV